jgi:hypothetical protein
METGATEVSRDCRSEAALLVGGTTAATARLPDAETEEAAGTGLPADAPRAVLVP